MTDFYTRMQTTANKLLKDKGQSLTISRQTAGAYDPATGTSTVVVTTQTGTGAIFDYGIYQMGIYNIPGSLVQAGDKQLLLSAVNSTGTALTAPEVNDTVTDAGGDVWTITQVKTLAPAGTVVMYDCNLRGAA